MIFCQKFEIKIKLRPLKCYLLSMKEFVCLFVSRVGFDVSTETQVLYMSLDWFHFAVESRDLSEADKSVFFPKAEWWVAELLFLSLNNWGLNFLQNESSQFSQIYLSPEKLSKVFTFQSCKWLFAKLSKFTKMTTIFTQIVVLSENRCHFVNLLSFASSYFFLSLRKITWLNSQDFLLRTQNEAPGLF